jgi:uncharacterized protein YecE (DUF72 family)
VIRVGVAGWDYPDWAGIVYPSPLPRGFDRLAFLSGFIDTVEINVTFYRPIEAKTSTSWVNRAPEGDAFIFTAKLHRSLTHAGGPSMKPGTAEADLPAEARSYLDGIRPLLGSRRLGAVLMQFPHAFHDRPASRRHVERVVELLPDLPLVAEFRHRSWDNQGALVFLKELGVGFCNIDQPSLGSTLPPTEHVTSRIAYVRLHGRNAANWFVRKEKGGEPAARRETGSARYDYLYSMAELLPWVDRVRRMAESAEEVFIIANNHYRGKGPANALMMKSVLASRRVRAPADLAAAFPDLKEMTEPVEVPAARSPKQGRLF